MADDEGTEGAAEGEGTEKAELDALRARTALLESELADAQGRKHRRPRTVVALVVIVIGALLVPAGIALPWLRSEVLNTDHFVATFGPLADNPKVQEVAATAITEAVMREANVEAEVEDVLPDRAKVLAGPITTGVQNVVNQVAHQVLASEQFRTLFKKSLELAHKQVVALLRDENVGSLKIEGGKVILDLASVTQVVVDKLAEQGLTFVKKIPTDKITGEVVLFESQALADARTAVSIFVAVSWIMPFVALGLLLIGIWIAPDHRRGLLWAAIALFLGAVAVGVSLGIARTVYLNQIQSRGYTGEVAIIVFDRVVSRLRDITRGVALIGLITAAFAFFAGTSKAAVSSRRFFSRSTQWASGRVVPSDPTAREVLVWIRTHRRGLQLAVFGLAAAWILLFSASLSASLVLWTAFFVVLGLVLVEVASRSGATIAQQDADGDTPPTAPADPTATAS